MKNTILLFVLIISVLAGMAQSVGINSDGTAPRSSAMLDVRSTTKGFLAPSMTSAQQALIISSAAGLLVYLTDGTAGYYYNSGTTASPVWTKFGLASDASQWTTAGSNFFYSVAKWALEQQTQQSRQSKRFLIPKYFY